jgi:ubiquinone/menaquinone biosynthesis C-methylase UbiE
MAGMNASASESVSFDRAAGFYDATRGLPPEVAQAQTALLLAELGDADRPVLEIGVGTGRISAPLAERHWVVGIDLSREMLRVLADKRSGVVAVEADAVRLPFGSATFGAVLACHILHLVRDWRRAVDEVVRVLTPGGVLLASRGRPRTGLPAELDRRLRRAAGLTGMFIGLDDLDELDADLTAKGWVVQSLEPIPQPSRWSIANYFDAIESNLFSWTWPLSDEQRLAAVREVRAWVAAELGEPARTPMPIGPIHWRVYRRP